MSQYYTRPRKSKKNHNLITGNGFSYEKLKKLGAGTYGVVYKAKDLTMPNKPIVAIKKILSSNDSPELELDATTIREIALLQYTSNHPNIISLNKTLYARHNLYLEFEYCDCDLQTFLRKSASLNPFQIKSIIHQIFTGIEFLHSQRILHRDLKPQNILINRKSLEIKIADFGLSREYSLGRIHRNRNYRYGNQIGWTHDVVTLWYRPPEILLGDDFYGTSADIWSIACIFIEIINGGKVLFQGYSEIDLLYKIFKICGTPNSRNYPHASSLRFFNRRFPKFHEVDISHVFIKEYTDKLAVDLVSRILIMNPNKRLSAKQVLRHPYFWELKHNRMKKDS